jgi:hypothetical protein
MDYKHTTEADLGTTYDFTDIFYTNDEPWAVDEEIEDMEKIERIIRESTQFV